LLRVGESETISGLGMREAGGIEIEAEAVGLRPADPILEVGGVDFVAVHALAAELAINRVQTHAMFAGDKRKGLFDVGPQFLRCARLAGVIAGNGEATTQRAVRVFETADVIALPAMER